MIGCLLLLSAGLKSNGWGEQEPLPHLAWLALPAIRVGIILGEGLLGVWLLIGFLRNVAWIAAVVTFSVFASVNAYAGWIGRASCDCFGRFKLDPWYVLALDVGCLLLLLVSRPAWNGGAVRSRLPAVARWVAVVGVLLGALLAASWVWFGSPRLALSYLRGERLTLEPPYLDLGTGKNGDVRQGTVTVRNLGDHPVRIVGGTSDCSCLTTQDLPQTVEPGKTRDVTVRFRYPPNSTGAYSRDIRLMTDDPEQQYLVIRISCLVVSN